MHPFASLPENLTAFCAVLRREHGFRVGPRELQDAARALQIASIGDERAVRNTLRPILSSTLDDAMVFDRAFRAFFHRRPVSPVDEEHLPDRREQEEGAPARDRSGHAVAADSEPSPSDVSRMEAGSPGVAIDVTDAESDQAAGLLRSTYSPVQAEGEPLDLAPADRWWRAAAAVFVARVQTALSRRWSPARRGPRFDLRRTLRSSLHTGGEPVLARWQARPRLRPRFVIFVDGSRSMGAHTGPALRTAVAIAAVAANVEVFVFSTELRRITRDVRRAAAGTRRRLPELHHAWGGGTGIGLCLRDFVHRYGARVLGRDTVVMIASDGLDAGAPGILRQVMSELHRRAAAIIWLNPFAGTSGYEPSALGMRAARPFVNTFAWAGDAAGLLRLARVVRVRS